MKINPNLTHQMAASPLACFCRRFLPAKRAFFFFPLAPSACSSSDCWSLPYSIKQPKATVILIWLYINKAELK